MCQKLPEGFLHAAEVISRRWRLRHMTGSLWSAKSSSGDGSGFRSHIKSCSAQEKLIPNRGLSAPAQRSVEGSAPKQAGVVRFVLPSLDRANPCPPQKFRPAGVQGSVRFVRNGQHGSHQLSQGRGRAKLRRIGGPPEPTRTTVSRRFEPDTLSALDRGIRRD